MDLSIYNLKDCTVSMVSTGRGPFHVSITIETLQGNEAKPPFAFWMTPDQALKLAKQIETKILDR